MLNLWKSGSRTIAVLQSVIAILFISLTCAAQTASSQPSPQTVAEAKSRIVVPAGNMIPVALTRPIMAKTAKAGDAVYGETAFPVAVANQMAIPPGTFVQGQIDTLKKPGWFSPHAQLQIHFSKIIFASGYTVELPQKHKVKSAEQPNQQISGASAPEDDIFPAVANAYVDVSSSNDVLLDNGAQIDVVLQVPLRLNAAQVATAVRVSNFTLPQFKSATECRPTPGYPGTPDTVIPGTPGTPGTPDTVIPGMNGAPDTVIPGIPATPGTPDTVIPGTPGYAGTYCPPPPVVTPSNNVESYKQSFQMAVPAQVWGKQLPAGNYQATWQGPGLVVQVNFTQNGQSIITAPARLVALNRKSPADAIATQINPDGSLVLQSIRFAGRTFALIFDEGTHE